MLLEAWLARCGSAGRLTKFALFSHVGVGGSITTASSIRLLASLSTTASSVEMALLGDRLTQEIGPHKGLEMTPCKVQYELLITMADTL